MARKVGWELVENMARKIGRGTGENWLKMMLQTDSPKPEIIMVNPQRKSYGLKHINSCKYYIWRNVQEK
jgi:hypothetical protein